MSDKPKILTVAEIDALAWVAPFADPAFASLLRMARAMAVLIERVAEATNIIDNQWAVTAYTDGPHARRAVRVGLVEAIEATEEP